MSVNERLSGKIFEAWYSIDSILFNDHARKVIVSEKLFNEYITLKSALLSNIFEYWNQIDFRPSKKSIKELKITDGQKAENLLIESAVFAAKKSKAIASNLLTKSPFKDKIKNHIVKESIKGKIKDIRKYNDRLITEKFLQLAIDNIMIGMPMLESFHVGKSELFEVKILEEAYKTIRTSLIHLALSCKRCKDC